MNLGGGGGVYTVFSSLFLIFMENVFIFIFLLKMLKIFIDIFVPRRHTQGGQVE